MFRELFKKLNESDLDKWVAVDFDGVCATYDEWKGVDVFGEPITAVARLIDSLRTKGYKVLLNTTRQETPALKQWLEDNGFHFDAINSSEHNPDDAGKFKPIAELYIDDRAFRFDPDDPDKSVEEIERVLQYE